MMVKCPDKAVYGSRQEAIEAARQDLLLDPNGESVEIHDGSCQFEARGCTCHPVIIHRNDPRSTADIELELQRGSVGH